MSLGLIGPLTVTSLKGVNLALGMAAP
jgi:hypothetical protein